MKLLNTVLGYDSEKISTLSTEKLYSIVNKWGLPLDDDLFEEIAWKSNSLFDFMDKYEEQTGNHIPNEHSDNFLAIIEIIWEREFTDVVNFDMVISKYYEFQRSERSYQVIKDQIVYFANIMENMTDNRDSEFIETFFDHYEIISWIANFAHARTHFEDHDEMREDLETILSSILKIDIESSGVKEAEYYIRLPLAEVYALSNMIDASEKQYRIMDSNDPKNSYLYSSWVDNHPNSEIIHYNDKNKEIEPKLEIIENILLKGINIALEAEENHNLLKFYENLSLLYKNWKDEKCQKYIDKYNQLKTELEKEKEEENKRIENVSEDIDYSELDLSMLKDNLLFDENEPITIELICYECGLGYKDQVEYIQIIIKYIISDKFLENESKLENGWIIFNKEIRCSNCNSYKFQLAMRTKMKIQMNIETQLELPMDQRKIITLNADFGMKSLNSVKDVIKYWQRKAKRETNKTKSFTNAAKFLMMYNHYDLAKKYLLKAIKNDGEIEYALFLLGHIYHCRDDKKRAAACFKKVHRINPNLINRIDIETTSEIIEFYHEVVP